MSQNKYKSGGAESQNQPLNYLQKTCINPAIKKHKLEESQNFGLALLDFL